MTRQIILLLVLAFGLVGCDGLDRARSPSFPSPIPQAAPEPVPPPTPAPNTTLRVFTEASSGYSTTDLRDAQEQIVQINTGNELIWAADGTHLPGYAANTIPGFSRGPVHFIEGKICPEGCAFEIRFGTRDGERRAYLTVDYGHDNPGTVVDVEVAGGALLVAQTDTFPPGTFTLSGVITEATPAGHLPVEGAVVSRGMTTGWQNATTDRDGRYRLPGMYDGTDIVSTGKDGYRRVESRVPINGDTRFDMQLVRE